jgi:hypothetical protein
VTASVKHPGRATVYAARTLPGEVIEGKIDGNRIETPGIVTPSADRVSAALRALPELRRLRPDACLGYVSWRTGKPDVIVSALARSGARRRRCGRS